MEDTDWISTEGQDFPRNECPLNHLSLVGEGCRIDQLNFYKGVTPLTSVMGKILSHFIQVGSGAVEYTDCISAEGPAAPNERLEYDIKQSN